MNRHTRSFLQLAVAAALGAACASTTSPQPTTPPELTAAATVSATVQTAGPPTPAPTATVNQTPVTLIYWAEPRFGKIIGREAETANSGDYERLLAKEFMRRHPNVIIEVEVLTYQDLAEKVPAAIAAGAPPDLLKDFLGRTSRYAWQGLTEPLDKAIPAEDLADFQPALIEQYTIDGQLHGLPLYFWVNGLFGNRSLFEEAGVGDLLPTDGEWTVDEFEQAMKAVARPGALWPLGLALGTEQGDYRYLGFFWSMGAQVYANRDYSRVALHSLEGVAALEKLVAWYDAALLPPGAVSLAQVDVETLLIDRQVALVGKDMFGYRIVENLRNAGTLKEPWEPAIVMYPHAEGVRSGGLAAGPTGVVVFKQETEAERYWAIEFARFLAEPELIREYAVNSFQFPTRLSVGNPLPENEQYQRVLDWVAEWGVEDMGLSSPHYYEVRVLLFPELQAALLREKTPAEALADYEALANAVLGQP